MNLQKICNRIIEYSFYSLFFLVPLVLSKDTSELFELNKMWLTWGLTIIIATAWFTKMILEKRFFIQRTPLDIPIILFLASQIVSTIFSLDVHVSIWGYYSRFNGGLLSIISYILLYYAFLSNFDSQRLSSITHKLLAISLISGFIVALWGLPSHFGFDPTCLLFRGTFDVSCWTADFQPMARIFSTLGQPDWLAAYLAILIPIAIAYLLGKWKMENGKWKIWAYLSLASLFYIDLLYSGARSGILGTWISLAFFALAYFLINKPKISFSLDKLKSLPAILFFGFLIITFIIGTPITQLRMVTLEGIRSIFQKPAIVQTVKPTETKKNTEPARKASEAGGTESGNIRLNVWTGAINTWKNNPIFGTGVETFAYAYYKYKPVGQNLTSEWNFLYNKAHNEYLNYLATTGIVGLGTYLLMIGSFLFLSLKQLKIQNEKLKITIQNSKLEKEKFLTSNYNFSLLTLNFALLAAYISILITNFFGFSVVIVNIYLFMIPAFIFVLNNTIKNDFGNQSPKTKGQRPDTSIWQWTSIFFIILASLFMIRNLFQFWRADIAYALGYNLDRAGEYQQANKYLHQAVNLRNSEPVFRDEFSINNAVLASELIAQKNQSNQEQSISTANTHAQKAIDTSNEIISQHQNNVVFWKTRVRLFYTLAQVDSRYLPRALDSIKKAYLIAPNDANISYNLGVLYGQNNNIAKGIESLERAVSLKPDYRDAHFALGLFYRTASLDTKGKAVIDKNLNDKAITEMKYILNNISGSDPGALESLNTWK